MGTSLILGDLEGKSTSNPLGLSCAFYAVLGVNPSERVFYIFKQYS